MMLTVFPVLADGSRVSGIVTGSWAGPNDICIAKYRRGMLRWAARDRLTMSEGIRVAELGTGNALLHLNGLRARDSWIPGEIKGFLSSGLVYRLKRLRTD